MTPEKALELVGKYARLTMAIKACKPAIGDHLDRCEKKHLDDWYARPEKAEYEENNYDVPVMISPPGEWLVIGDEQKAECEHCYGAHLIVQDRKRMRKELAIVKRSMTRSATC